MDHTIEIVEVDGKNRLRVSWGGLFVIMSTEDALELADDLKFRAHEALEAN
jgi:hypothetical protein